MPIRDVGRLVSTQVAEHDIAWCRVFRERAALMESYGGSSGDENSDSELEEVPSLEDYRQLMENTNNVV